MMILNNIQKLSSEDMAMISGGGLFGSISKIFGREGKPFFGKDFSAGVAVVAKVGAIAFPAAAPVLVPVGNAASAAAVVQKSNE